MNDLARLHEPPHAAALEDARRCLHRAASALQAAARHDPENIPDLARAHVAVIDALAVLEGRRP